MPVFYDVLDGDIVQVGGELQEFSSNGWQQAPGIPFVDSDEFGSPVETQWDGQLLSRGSPAELDGPQVAWSMVDACMHLGELHVVWVEPQFDPAHPTDPVTGLPTKMMRGPFVKKFSGGAWVAVGGEVEDNLTPISWRWPFSTGTAYLNTEVSPLGPIGTRHAPSRPRICSDGVNLFVAYYVREIAPAAEVPPLDSYLVYGFDRSARHPVTGALYQNWDPRKFMLRRWTGSTWEVYGNVAAISNNVSNYSPAQGGYGRVSHIGIDAVPDGTGVVYAAWAEIGTRGSAMYYVAPPNGYFHLVVLGYAYTGTWTMKGVSASLRFAKFDGSSTDGEVKEIRQVQSTDGVHVIPNGNYLDAVFDDPVSIQLAADNFALQTLAGDPGVGAQSGTGFVVWTESGQTPYSREIKMTRFDDLADVQTLTPDFGADTAVHWQFAFCYDAVAEAYIIQESFGFQLYSVAQDGTQPFIPVGLVTRPFAFPGPFGLVASEAADGADNIWGVMSYRASTAEYEIALFHRPCEGIDDQNRTASRLAGLFAGIGFPKVVVDGDELYAAGAWRDPSSTAVDFKILVFKHHICRDCLQCGGGGGAVREASLIGRFRVADAEGGDPDAGGGIETAIRVEP